MKKASILLVVVCCILSISTTSFAAWRWKSVNKSYGQVILIPAAHVDFSYTKDSQTMDQRVISVFSIRNADLKNPIILKSVGFYDPDGNLVKEFLDTSQTINPLASMRFTTSEAGLSYYSPSGKRPSFLVEWIAPNKVVAPSISAGDSITRPDGDGREFLALATVHPKVIKERILLRR